MNVYVNFLFKKILDYRLCHRPGSIGLPPRCRRKLNDFTPTWHAKRLKRLYVDLAVTGQSKTSTEASAFSRSFLSHEIRMHTLVCNNRLVDRKATKKTHIENI